MLIASPQGLSKGSGISLYRRGSVEVLWNIPNGLTVHGENCNMSNRCSITLLN